MELADLNIISGPHFAEKSGICVTDESRLYEEDYIPFIAVGFGYGEPNWLNNPLKILLLNPETNELWDISTPGTVTGTHNQGHLPGLKMKLDSSSYSDIIKKILEAEPVVAEPAPLFSGYTWGSPGSGYATTDDTTCGWYTTSTISNSNPCGWYVTDDTTTAGNFKINTSGSATNTSLYFNH